MNHNMKMKHNMMKKLSSEKRNVDSEDPDIEAAGGGIGKGGTADTGYLDSGYGQHSLHACCKY